MVSTSVSGGVPSCQLTPTLALPHRGGGREASNAITLRLGRRAGWGLSARRIGLLGGSFNPAHQGHLHISRLALSRLDLDEVWWLVSPQNPLKPTAGMMPFAERLRQVP